MKTIINTISTKRKKINYRALGQKSGLHLCVPINVKYFLNIPAKGYRERHKRVIYDKLSQCHTFHNPALFIHIPYSRRHVSLPFLPPVSRNMDYNTNVYYSMQMKNGGGI